MACQCLDQLNKLLEKDTNTRIQESIWINMRNGSSRTTATIATAKRDPKSRVKPRSFQATFCPFCGERYVSETEEADQVTAD